MHVVEKQRLLVPSNIDLHQSVYCLDTIRYTNNTTLECQHLRVHVQARQYMIQLKLIDTRTAAASPANILMIHQRQVTRDTYGDSSTQYWYHRHNNNNNKRTAGGAIFMNEHCLWTTTGTKNDVINSTESEYSVVMATASVGDNNALSRTGGRHDTSVVNTQDMKQSAVRSG